jgi:hypothetical protein
MMVVSQHDRISGHANRVRLLDRFLTYVSGKSGMWFARKDEIANLAIEHRATTPVYDRGAPAVTGLPGSAGSEEGPRGYTAHQPQRSEHHARTAGKRGHRRGAPAKPLLPTR